MQFASFFCIIVFCFINYLHFFCLQHFVLFFPFFFLFFLEKKDKFQKNTALFPPSLSSFMIITSFFEFLIFPIFLEILLGEITGKVGAEIALEIL